MYVSYCFYGGGSSLPPFSLRLPSKKMGGAFGLRLCFYCLLLALRCHCELRTES